MWNIFERKIRRNFFFFTVNGAVSAKRTRNWVTHATHREFPLFWDISTLPTLPRPPRRIILNNRTQSKNAAKFWPWWNSEKQFRQGIVFKYLLYNLTYHFRKPRIYLGKTDKKKTSNLIWRNHLIPSPWLAPLNQIFLFDSPDRIISRVFCDLRFFKTIRRLRTLSKSGMWKEFLRFRLDFAKERGEKKANCGAETPRRASSRSKKMSRPRRRRVSSTHGGCTHSREVASSAEKRYTGISHFWQIEFDDPFTWKKRKKKKLHRKIGPRRASSFGQMPNSKMSGSSRVYSFT